eukprot:gene7330-biopygen7541
MGSCATIWERARPGETAEDTPGTCPQPRKYGRRAPTWPNACLTNDTDTRPRAEAFRPGARARPAQACTLPCAELTPFPQKINAKGMKGTWPPRLTNTIVELRDAHKIQRSINKRSLTGTAQDWTDRMPGPIPPEQKPAPNSHLGSSTTACPWGIRTLARAWRGHGAGYRLQFGMSGMGVARTWRGHVLFPLGQHLGARSLPVVRAVHREQGNTCCFDNKKRVAGATKAMHRPKRTISVSASCPPAARQLPASCPPAARQLPASCPPAARQLPASRAEAEQRVRRDRCRADAQTGGTDD